MPCLPPPTCVARVSKEPIDAAGDERVLRPTFCLDEVREVVRCSDLHERESLRAT